MAKILWLIHAYPPDQNAGAEWMAKEINDYLLQQRHEVTICVDKSRDVWAMEIENSAIVITHLDRSQEVTELCQARKKPCINIIHHNWEIPHLRRLYDNIACVYNSEWIAKDRKYPHPGIVVCPPVNPDRFAHIELPNLGDGNITLANCNRDKGALIFQEIARFCPDLKFLAVKGHHGQQLPVRGRNVRQIECQTDISTVFAQTSLLLVPSVYESYGRIAVEAMACGIPVIANDTPGLRESLGELGMFAPRKQIQSWLYNIRVGNKPSPDALKGRAAELWQTSLVQLKALDGLIKSMI